MMDYSKANSNPRPAIDATAELGSKSMRIADIMIDWRDRLLDVLSGTLGGTVLNPAGYEDPLKVGMDPAADLKQALDAVKVTAIDQTGSRVDYDELRSSHAYQVTLKEYLGKLSAFDPESLASREDRLAFWINLYNALTMDAVIELGVKQSVGEGRFGLLSFFRQAAYNVGGLRLSLDDIEHGILRGNRGHPFIPGAQFASHDPRQKWMISPSEVRIHFAINCASRSCPPVQVYQGLDLDDQLTLAARNFVDNSVRIDPENKSLHLSQIFKWFEADFGGRDGVLELVIDHLPKDERQAWISENFSELGLRYEKYDWSLNT